MSKKIKIALNAVPLMSPLTGIGQYVRALSEELINVEELDLSFFYGVGWEKVIREQALPPTADSLKLFVRKNIPYSYELRRWAQQKTFKSGIKKFKPNLYHEPAFLTYRFEGPTVLSVHDLSWIRYSHAHPKERVRAMHKFFVPSLSRADLIITDTHFVKQELIDVFGVEASKIHPIHLAAEELFRPRLDEETKSILDSRGLLHGQYWLSVGTLEPRKNLKLLFEAFMQLSVKDRKRCPLVVMGMNGWGNESWQSQLQSMIDSGEVIYTGYLPRHEQAVIVSGAKALIYPSLYEGFGLPLVEAMQSGVPVIAANASCLPEVVGAAGLLVNPHDSDFLKEKLCELLDDKDILVKLTSKSLQRSADFSWRKCAQQTLDVYKIALN
jgi:glycosyltransferase involved in cell wall biosynthesis